MTLAKAIRILEKEYETAKKLEMVRKPLSYALYKIEFYILRKKSKLNLDCCTAEQITYCCKLLKYKKDKIDLAIKFFVEKYTNLQVYNWLCENKLNVEYETVAKYKYRILKDLREFEKKS